MKEVRFGKKWNKRQEEAEKRTKLLYRTERFLRILRRVHGDMSKV